MTPAEWTVSIVGLVAGYFFVSRFIDGRPADSNKRSAIGEPERATLSNWYQILGVRENASKDEIIAAYQQKISQHDPDKAAQLSEELRAVAEAKSKLIRSAYDIGMRLFT